MTKNVTISVSDELAKKMDAMPEINWSEVCRQAISKYINKRSEEKGELLKGLEDFLKTKPPEGEESVKKAEIERFTRRWGTPEIISLRTQPPHVQLRKIQTVKIGDTPLATLKIFNDVLLTCTPIVDPKRTKLSEFDAEIWQTVKLIEEFQPIVDYFKLKGFTVGECKLIPSLIEVYLADGDKELAKEFMALADFYGLFAFDNKDIVFIAYREVKPK